VWVASTSSTWAIVEALTTATNKRGIVAYRRTVTDGEPAEHVFNVAAKQELIAGLLVYRGIEAAAAMVAGSAIDYSALTYPIMPALSTVRASDLYLGGVAIVNPGGVTITAPDGSPERLEYEQSLYGVTTLRLHVHDAQKGVVGKVGTRVTGTAVSGGIAFAAVFAGQGLAGKQQSIDPTIRGTIGLTSVGV
jgi:hypothetical protein